LAVPLVAAPHTKSSSCKESRRAEGGRGARSPDGHEKTLKKQNGGAPQPAAIMACAGGRRARTAQALRGYKYNIARTSFF
jgi:hypothetical protein